MRYSHLYFLLFLLISITSCSNSGKRVNTYDESVIVIDAFKYATLDTEDLLRDYTPVVMESENEDALFGSITKIRVSDGRIFLMDKYFTRKLLIFDTDGRFITKVSQVGRGPLEYVEIENFELDHIRKEVILQDVVSKKILVYDFDGNYLYTVPLPFGSEAVALAVSGNYVHGNGLIAGGRFPVTGEYKFIITDSLNQEILGKYIHDDIQPGYGFAVLNMLSSPSDGNISIVPSFSNEIWTTDGLTASVKYKVDFPDGEVDLSVIYRYDHPRDFETSSEGSKEYVRESFENEEYLYFCTLDIFNRLNYFYNKRTGQLFRTGDMLSGMSLIIDDNGYVWGNLHPRSFDDDERPVAAPMKELPQDGPILVKYKLPN